MSLKNFHVVFIVAATLLALFCAVRAFDSYRLAASSSAGAALVLSLIAASALVVYEARFLRQCRARGIR